MTRLLVLSLDFGGLPTPPLDLVGSAAAAYGLRKLRSAYAGNCLKVRRASDDTTQDIGFSGGLLNIGALQTFCAGTNGFIDTWYDQSGNANDATQATLASQPQIVSAGTTLVFGGNSRPRLDFDGTDDYFTITNLTAQAMSIFACANGESTGYRGLCVMHANGIYASMTTDFPGLYLGSDQQHTTTLGATHAILSAVIRAANDADIVFNGALENKTGGSSFATRGASTIGADPTPTQYHLGDMAELIIYNSALTAASRTIVEDNMGLWAGITMS